MSSRPRAVLDPTADLVALLRNRAQERPAQACFIFLSDGETEATRDTYASLDRAARCLATQLQRCAVQGERALLIYPPGLDYIRAFFACLYAGMVAVPAYPPSRHRLERLKAIIDDAKPAIVLSTTDLHDKLSGDPRGLAQCEALPWLLTDAPDQGEADGWTPPAIEPDSLAFLQYTSGSTGDPKGVMVSHGNLLANQHAIKHAFRHSEHSTVVGWLPLYHDMGLIGNILQPLYTGSTAVLMPPMAFLEQPLRWLRAISKYQAHTSGGPNFAYELCVRKIPEDSETRA